MLSREGKNISDIWVDGKKVGGIWDNQNNLVFVKKGFLSYIETPFNDKKNGTCVLNSKIIFKENSKLEIAFIFLKLVGDSDLGVISFGSLGEARICTYNSKGNYQIRLQDNKSNVYFHYVTYNNDFNICTIENNKLSVNNQSKIYSFPKDFITNQNIYLLNSISNRNQSNYKFFYIKYYEDNILLHDFRPYFYINNYGLKDIITNEFLYHKNLIGDLSQVFDTPH